jgi:hypothetical protein
MSVIIVAKGLMTLYHVPKFVCPHVSFLIGPHIEISCYIKIYKCKNKFMINMITDNLFFFRFRRTVIMSIFFFNWLQRNVLTIYFLFFFLGFLDFLYIPDFKGKLFFYLFVFKEMFLMFHFLSFSRTPVSCSNWILKIFEKGVMYFIFFI